MPTALRQLREDKHLSARTAITLIHATNPSLPESQNALLNIERRGTTDYDWITAIATAYGLEHQVVADAARPPGKILTPVLTKS